MSILLILCVWFLIGMFIFGSVYLPFWLPNVTTKTQAIIQLLYLGPFCWIGLIVLEIYIFIKNKVNKDFQCSY